MARTLTVSCLLMAVALCAGCGGGARNSSMGYYLENLDGINRVVLVELAADKGSEDNARNMTLALDKALQGKRLFRVETMARTHSVLRDLALNKRTALTFDEVRAMQEQLQTDAIIFGAVTQCNVYPRMEVGLYMRMLDLRRNVVVWAVDHTWDTTDKPTEQRMKTFFDEHLREDLAPAGWRMVRMSPLTFQKFIAYEIVAPLPMPPIAAAPGRGVSP